MTNVVENQTLQYQAENGLNVEHIYNKETEISMVDTILSMINNKIDRIVGDYYHDTKVNITSHTERKMSA